MFIGRTEELVDSDCLPPGHTLRTPRKISKDDLILFFEYIEKRQDTYESLYTVFHFIQVTAGKGDRSLIPAQYDAAITNLEPSADALPTKARKKKNPPQYGTRMVFDDVAQITPPDVTSEEGAGQGLPNVSPLASNLQPDHTLRTTAIVASPDGEIVSAELSSPSNDSITSPCGEKNAAGVASEGNNGEVASETNANPSSSLAQGAESLAQEVEPIQRPKERTRRKKKLEIGSLPEEPESRDGEVRHSVRTRSQTKAEGRNLRSKGKSAKK